MRHYDGVTPDQRYRNEMLELLRSIDSRLEQLGNKSIEDAIETPTMPVQVVQRRKRGPNRKNA